MNTLQESYAVFVTSLHTPDPSCTPARAAWGRGLHVTAALCLTPAGNTAAPGERRWTSHFRLIRHIQQDSCSNGEPTLGGDVSGHHCSSTKLNHRCNSANRSAESAALVKQPRYGSREVD